MGFLALAHLSLMTLTESLNFSLSLSFLNSKTDSGNAQQRRSGVTGASISVVPPSEKVIQSKPAVKMVLPDDKNNLLQMSYYLSMIGNISEFVCTPKPRQCVHSPGPNGGDVL